MGTLRKEVENRKKVSRKKVGLREALLSKFSCAQGVLFKWQPQNTENVIRIANLLSAVKKLKQNASKPLAGYISLTGRGVGKPSAGALIRFVPQNCCWKSRLAVDRNP